jgi:hypothetical protein
MIDATGQDETQGDGYECFLEQMGTQLDQAASRRASQLRRRRRVATGGLALSTVVAGVALVIGGGTGRVDVIAQAEAALASTGQVLRLVTVSQLEMRGGTHAEIAGSEAESLGWNKPRTAEQWSASEPTRWRIATTIPTATRAGPATAAPIQCAYSAGSEETYDQGLQTNEVVIVPVSSGQDESSQESPCTIQVSGGLGTQPVAHIHAMLESGALKAAGKTTVNGHEVLRLTGQETRPQGPAAGPAASWPIEYDVDPETYAPVRFTVEMVGADALGNSGTLTEVTEVTGYEELSLTEATTGLLRLKTTGSPVIRHGINQYEKRREAAAASRESATNTATAARSLVPRRTHRHS